MATWTTVGREQIPEISYKEEIPEVVMNHIRSLSADLPAAKNALKGRKGLRTSKPRNGIYAYVWRMIRFHSGIDPHMPMTADWDLSAQISDQFGYRVSFALTGEKTHKEVLDLLDTLVEKMCTEFGLNSFRAALIWHKAGLF